MQLYVLIGIYMAAALPISLGLVSAIWHGFTDGIKAMTSTAAEAVEHVEVAPRRLALVGETQ
ncbi:hypothetical protein [Smaragdicoccus niigatensis]|uniref:hypothetical protein n=1 Tax=Smaragdicoccus niigatensis TaxID=359359 RepID=UPI00036296C7|nr:hypothetical protein [Smaragdicoccus niigatensis]